MIAKKYRLPIKNLTHSTESIFKNPNFLLKVYPSRLSFNRFGVIISKKFDRRAVKRNLWRRRILSVVRDWPNSNKDFLIIPNPKLKNLSFAEFKKELEQICAKNLKP